MVAAILSIQFNISSNCTDTIIDLREILSDTTITLSATDVSTSDTCEVTVIVVTDCGDSEPVTMSERWDYIMCCR